MSTRALLSTLFAILGLAANAQQAWDLEKCILHAQQNSISIRQAELGIENATLTNRQNRNQRLPTLNGGTGYGFNLGRSIDPTTNSFETQTSQFNGFSLQSSWVAYQGGAISNGIKQSELDLQAARLDAEQASDNIALQVAQAYLQVLFAEENLNAARERLAVSEAQLERTGKLVDAGVLPERNRFDVQATVARDQQIVVGSENALGLALLSLKQLLMLDADADIRLVRPNIDVERLEVGTYSAQEVFEQAYGAQPQVKAGELRSESARLGERIARAGLLPTISFSAGLSSNYSSLARTVTGVETSFEDVDLLLNGVPVTVGFPSQNFNFAEQPYFEQLEQNLGGNVSVQLSVPIFNQNRARLGMERARLNAVSAELQNQQIEQQLRSAVQTSVADAQAAKKQYEASRRSVEALRLSFEALESQYNVGAVNALDYGTARNNLQVAESDMIRAKYDYLLKIKVVDFYMGKPLSL